MVHDFVCNLSAKLQTSYAIRMYNNQKSFDEIAEECGQVWKLALARGSKRPRTQVNFVEDFSEEEEQERETAMLPLILWTTTRPASGETNAEDRTEISPGCWHG